MALLTNDAIALLERIPETWTPLDQAAITFPADTAALHELKREQLVETQVWPSLPATRRVSWRTVGSDRVVQRTEIRLTPRGSSRLQRLRSGRQRSREIAGRDRDAA